ncbi:hypothetical protein [Alcanivorax jadensis]|nr:hypothetical protein [Alcanivorax jadensis]
MLEIFWTAVMIIGVGVLFYGNNLGETGVRVCGVCLFAVGFWAPGVVA